MQQLRQPLIDPRHQPVLQALEVVLMRVPAAVGHGDEPHARLDQPARQQAALAELVLAVCVAQLRRLPGSGRTPRFVSGAVIMLRAVL